MQVVTVNYGTKVLRFSFYESAETKGSCTPAAQELALSYQYACNHSTELSIAAQSMVRLDAVHSNVQSQEIGIVGFTVGESIQHIKAHNKHWLGLGRTSK
jgi:hypothetical protein